MTRGGKRGDRPNCSHLDVKEAHPREGRGTGRTIGTRIDQLIERKRLLIPLRELWSRATGEALRSPRKSLARREMSTLPVIQEATILQSGLNPKPKLASSRSKLGRILPTTRHRLPSRSPVSISQVATCQAMVSHN